jgi:hypothetical protein
MLMDISLFWKNFWEPVPPEDGIHIRWELKPVEYEVKDGKIVKPEAEEVNYGGTD